MTAASKFMTWASVLGLSTFAIVRGLPPRVHAEGHQRAIVSQSPASVPAAAPQQKVIVIRENAGQPPLPEFIDGGSFDVTSDQWVDIYSVPKKVGDWRDEPGLPKDVIEMQQLLIRHYTIHYQPWPDSDRPKQLEFMVNGQWNRHGFTPNAEVPNEPLGQIEFMRYRSTGIIAGTVIVRRYWTLGQNSAKPNW